MLYEKYLNTVDELAEEICGISDAIWDCHGDTLPRRSHATV